MSLPAFLLTAFALFIVATGSAAAASLITSANIKDESIQNRDLRDGAFTLSKLRASTIASLREDNAQTLARLAALEAKAGIAGPAGTTGAAGAKGDTGATGAKGDAGTNGTNGTNGVKGDTGTTGDKGDKGDTGTTGAKGDKGATGPTGNTGPAGPIGPTGPTGSNGANADGSVTAPVANDGDQGFGLATPTGTGSQSGGAGPCTATTCDNGSATLSGGKLNLAIAAPGGGFAEIGKSYAGTPISTLSSLAYDWARISAGTAAPVLKIDVTDAVPCAPISATCTPDRSRSTTTLIYEPVYSEQNSAPKGEALDPAGRWYSLFDIKGADERDAPNANGYAQSLAEIIADNPDMKIQRIYLQAGQNAQGPPWSGFQGTVDDLTVGFGTAAPIRYDFGG